MRSRSDRRAPPLERNLMKVLNKRHTTFGRRRRMGRRTAPRRVRVGQPVRDRKDGDRPR